MGQFSEARVKSVLLRLWGRLCLDSILHPTFVSVHVSAREGGGVWGARGGFHLVTQGPGPGLVDGSWKRLRVFS